MFRAKEMPPTTSALAAAMAEDGVSDQLAQTHRAKTITLDRQSCRADTECACSLAAGPAPPLPG